MNADTSPAAVASLREAGVLVAFSNRLGGVSEPPYDEANLSTRVGDRLPAVLENRRLLARRLGVAGRPIITVRQAHTRRVVPVSRSVLSAGPTEIRALDVVADGMVTREHGLVLMVGVADCVPVVLVDERSSVAGVLHVGWRGLLRGVVQEGVATLAAAGGCRGRCVAIIGRAIGPCCYAVGSAVRSAVTRAWPSAEAVTRAGEPSLDLVAGITEALAAEGVTTRDVQGGCTRDAAGTHFSVRRDGRTGSQAGLVALL